MIVRPLLIFCCCLPTGGCAAVQQSAYYPDRLSVSIGAGVGFDQQGHGDSPRNIGASIVVTPSWSLKAAPVAKVSDTTRDSQ